MKFKFTHAAIHCWLKLTVVWKKSKLCTEWKINIKHALSEH